ncbi:hypothetical protein [Cellvibrio sp. UBA7661]|uniref:McrB family protein n=1 Tax=Cellvibrio sp. UBA7661 TaxID=1946311 RepID=UPI002F354F9D
MLKNLKEIGDDLVAEFTTNFKYKDFILPNDFKERYLSLISDQSSLGYRKVNFHKYSAEIETNTGKTFSIPNYWFSVAAHFSPYINELAVYKSVIDQITKDLSLPKDWAKDKTIPHGFDSLSIENKEYLEKFITDYSWWRGGKTVDRTDYYVSPILKLANCLAETQSALAEICWQLAHIDDKVIVRSACLPFFAEGDMPIRSISSKKDLLLPKSFLLLAGISGTGKSRFIREQNSSKENFCLISVRPDWHEPSDLLGYVSRLTGKTEYNPTDALSFIVKAWANAWDHSKVSDNELSIVDSSQMETFWLCLDEMNLAPVEQYFSDYLSVIESRKWIAGNYTCDPLLKASTFECLKEGELKDLRKYLKIENSRYDNMWQYFSKVGIPVPPNLIVAGTVNMDETTHGFSRKVIDRALTIDFGEFFPNDFDQYLEPTIRTKTFSFPILSNVTKEDLAVLKFDVGGKKTIKFCKALNEKLKGSSFELAFRALNELLISLVCINPKDESELQAVWDDFLMTKVLPRIEGDADKLSVIGKDESILAALTSFLDETFSEIKAERIDFFREEDGKPVKIPCRSIAKIKWMQDRLNKATFTSFWP